MHATRVSARACARMPMGEAAERAGLGTAGITLWFAALRTVRPQVQHGASRCNARCCSTAQHVAPQRCCNTAHHVATRCGSGAANGPITGAELMNKCGADELCAKADVCAVVGRHRLHVRRPSLRTPARTLTHASSPRASNVSMRACGMPQSATGRFSGFFVMAGRAACKQHGLWQLRRRQWLHS